MTRSEIHQALTSGFATIAGSVFIAYVNLGVPAKDLLTSSLMSIPASIALSKLSMPEVDEPETLGTMNILDKGDDEDDSYNLLHSFSNGAWLGLRVAGLIFANVLCVVSALYAFNGESIHPLPFFRDSVLTIIASPLQVFWHGLVNSGESLEAEMTHFPSNSSLDTSCTH